MNFNIENLESSCFVSDKAWEMIIESGAYIAIKNTFFTDYKNHIVRFSINKNGMIELISRQKKPCKNYVLPALMVGMNFSQRSSVYLEQQRLLRGEPLDTEHFMNYAM